MNSRNTGCKLNCVTTYNIFIFTIHKNIYHENENSVPDTTYSVFPVCLAQPGIQSASTLITPFTTTAKHVPQFSTKAGSYGPPYIVLRVP